MIGAGASTRRRLGVGDRREPLGRRSRRAAVPAAHARRRRRGPHRQHRVDGRPHHRAVHVGLRRHQARRRRAVRVDVQGVRGDGRADRRVGGLPRAHQHQDHAIVAQPARRARRRGQGRRDGPGLRGGPGRTGSAAATRPPRWPSRSSRGSATGASTSCPPSPRSRATSRSAPRTSSRAQNPSLRRGLRRG